MSPASLQDQQLRTVLVTDASFAFSERAMLTRIEVGLADDGVDVRLALPLDADDPASFNVLREPLLYRPGGFAPFLRLSASRVSNLLQQDWHDDGRRIVHAFGGRCWRFAAELARALNAALVLEVWRMGLVRRARRFDAYQGRVVLAAPGAPIERALLGEHSAHPVRLTPWGGAVEPEPRALFSPGRRSAIVVVGRARDAAAYRAAFAAAAQASEAEDSLLLVDEYGVERAGIWSLARSVGALDRMTVVHRLEDRRDLILRADMMVHPDARGEYRSIVLDAMGAGLAVVAAEDPAFAPLVDGKSALCVAGHHQDDWTAAIGGLVRTPSKARELGSSARRFIGDQMRWSEHVGSLVNLYEGLARDGGFSGGGAGGGSSEKSAGRSAS